MQMFYISEQEIFLFELRIVSSVKVWESQSDRGFNQSECKPSMGHD